MTEKGGVIPFELSPNIQVSAEAFLKYRLIVIMKSRQIAESLIVAAYALHSALFKDRFQAMMISKGELEAMELLSKARRMYNHLPDWQKIKIQPDSKTELGFPDKGATIRALPSTEEAGVSFTASLIVLDEHEIHPFAERNYTYIKPTIEAGGQLISLFTVDKTKPDTTAKSLWLGGYDPKAPLHPICQKVPNMVYPLGPGKNGFVSIFFPYHVRPGRDEKWYEEVKGNLTGEHLGALTPELYMEQNYPRSLTEALRPTQTVAAIDLMVLDEMKKRCGAPVKVEGLDPLIERVWRPYQVGKVYVAASDTSHGVGKDYNVTVVMDARSGEVVADVFNNTMKPDEFAEHSVRLLSHFRNPRWYIEDNDWGLATIDSAKKLNYPNFGYQDAEHKKIGFHTGNSNRAVLWNTMVMAFNTYALTINNYQGLLQFGFLIRNQDRNGQIEAMKGKNDDYPCAVAIAHSKSQEVLKQATGDMTPIRTLHFSGARR